MTYDILVKGITPYMQHRMDDAKLEEWEKNRKQIIERPEVSLEDVKRAEYHCYRNTAGNCYIPSEQLRIAFINGASSLKGKVGIRTKSMTSVIAGCLQINPEEILLPDYDAIDKRSAVNKNVKARVMVIRPKWTTWQAKFSMVMDNDTVTKEMITQLIDITGKTVGIGSYRPTNKGYFGRFEAVGIELVR